jgi:hypothetical protein
MQPLLRWKGNNYYLFWLCICSFRCPECNAHAPYCHLWPVRLYKIFPHYLIKGKILEKKKLLNITCVFWFSRQVLSETFLILSKTERDMIKNVRRSSCKGPLFSSQFKDTRIFWADFRKILNIKFNVNPSSWSRVVPHWDTDRHKEANSSFYKFCERA